MEQNPYQAICGMFANPDPSDGMQICEGIVQAVSPLTISAFNVLLSGDGVRINAQLLSGWSQRVSIERQENPISGVETVLEGCLRVGDRVLCLAVGGLALYVLMKVVDG